MPEATVLEQLVRRDRAVIVAALVALTAVAWAYMFQMTGDLLPSEALGLPLIDGPVMTCCGADYGVTFVMWAVMMVAMMLPSAAPQVLTFALVNRRRSQRGGPFVPTGVFLGGYLLVWTAFSALAAGAQWALLRSGLLDAQDQRVGPALAAVLLAAAGVFQLTPAKRACMVHCSSPLEFLTSQWREGRRGALVMGLRHGAFCLGCCWLVMGLLFVAGVMNLWWVVAITVYVVAEKLLPWRRGVMRLGAAACFVGAAVLAARALGWSIVAWI